MAGSEVAQWLSRVYSFSKVTCSGPASKALASSSNASFFRLTGQLGSLGERSVALHWRQAHQYEGGGLGAKLRQGSTFCISALPVVCILL